MLKRTVFGLVLALVWAHGVAALAEPFIDDRSGVADDYFQGSFSTQNNSLDNLGSSMRSEHDYSAMTGSHNGLTGAQSNQTSTWQVSEDNFSNMMSQAVLSGGLHNSNGSNGTGYGTAGSYGSSMYGGGMYGGMYGSGSGSQIIPDSWGSSGNSYGSGNYYGGSSGVGW